MNKKVILMILDGWGHSPDPKVSAIDHANTPFIDSLYSNYPNAELRTDGLNVGLPEGQMGNSEVGHMNLGAGRIVYQDLAKINLAVQNKTMSHEKPLRDAFEYAKSKQKPIHFLGLVSDGGVHSHTSHLRGLIDAAQESGLERGVRLTVAYRDYRASILIEAGLIIGNTPTDNHVSANIRYLIDNIKAIKSTMVRINMSGHKQPLLISPIVAGTLSYRYLIMPLRCE